MSLYRINGEAPAEVEAIAPDRLIEGAPTTRTSLDYTRDNKIFAGEWSATAGACSSCASAWIGNVRGRRQLGEKRAPWSVSTVLFRSAARR